MENNTTNLVDVTIGNSTYSYGKDALTVNGKASFTQDVRFTSRVEFGGSIDMNGYQAKFNQLDVGNLRVNGQEIKNMITCEASLQSMYAEQRVRELHMKTEDKFEKLLMLLVNRGVIEDVKDFDDFIESIKVADKLADSKK